MHTAELTNFFLFHPLFQQQVISFKVNISESLKNLLNEPHWQQQKSQNVGDLDVIQPFITTRLDMSIN
jgi:hypothetical protein